MKYDRASKGSRGSASQWNGFLDMHKAFYGNTVGQGLIPPLLQSSTIVPATLKSGAEAIGAFRPVRLVKNFGFKSVVDTMPSYEVEPVDEHDTDRHGSYGFTLGEGVTASSGGRIVIAGLAIVAVSSQDLYYNKDGSVRGGSYDSMYYMVPDNTLSTDLEVISPVGHFKIVSWYDVSDVGSYGAAAALFIAVDMNQRPTSFLADIELTIPAATESSGAITMSNRSAYTYYGVVPSTVLENEVEVKKNENAYVISVYNASEEAIPTGTRRINYSLEYNRFIAEPTSSAQSVKIGTADEDITVGSTGTISIYRGGVDTTENETASLGWMAGSTQVSMGKEVMITWFADEGIWRITGAECEDSE